MVRLKQARHPKPAQNLAVKWGTTFPSWDVQASEKVSGAEGSLEFLDLLQFAM